MGVAPPGAPPPPPIIEGGIGAEGGGVMEPDKSIPYTCVRRRTKKGGAGLARSTRRQTNRRAQPTDRNYFRRCLRPRLAMGGLLADRGAKQHDPVALPSKRRQPHPSQ